jgi:hypothetical protein
MIKNEKDLKKSISHFNRFHRSLVEVKEVVDTGKLAEFYCSKLFNLKLVQPHNSSIDAVDVRGKRIEIKHRFAFKGIPPGMKLNLRKIDFVLYVELNKKLLPVRIFKIETKYIQRTSGDRVSFRKGFQDNKAKLIYKE